MSPAEQRTAALVKANEMRRVRRDLKRDLQSGAVSLADLLDGPHPAVADTPLLDVVLWTRRWRRMQSRGLAKLGEDAILARVNLLLPSGQASRRARLWCAEHGARGTRVRP